MKRNSEMISDDGGIEILVGYRYEQSESTLEENDGEYHVGCLCYTELDSVEVVIKGRGIEILPMLTDRQKDFIIANLTYE